MACVWSWAPYPKNTADPENEQRRMTGWSKAFVHGVHDGPGLFGMEKKQLGSQDRDLHGRGRLERDW